MKSYDQVCSGGIVAPGVSVAEDVVLVVDLSFFDSVLAVLSKSSKAP